jgi:hypothetical protein
LLEWRRSKILPTDRVDGTTKLNAKKLGSDSLLEVERICAVLVELPALGDSI